MILTLSEGGGEGGRAGRTSDNALGEGGESERQDARHAVLKQQWKKDTRDFQNTHATRPTKDG